LDAPIHQGCGLFSEIVRLRRLQDTAYKPTGKLMAFTRQALR
jgi:hypothetical protein